MFVVLGEAADEEDGADRAVWLFMLEDGAEAVAAGVTVQAEGARVVGHGVPVGKDQDRRLGQVEELAGNVSHGISGEEFDPLLEKGRGRA